MQCAVEVKLQLAKKKPMALQDGAAIVVNCLYSPFKLIAHAEQQESEKQAMKEQKQKAKDNTAAAKAAKKLAQTCHVDGCNTYSQKECGAKGWNCCHHCKLLFCKQHVSEWATHLSECEPKDDGSNEYVLEHV